MINKILETMKQRKTQLQMREGQQQQFNSIKLQTNPQYVQNKSMIQSQPHLPHLLQQDQQQKIIILDQLILIGIINIILLTVQLTIFNICFVIMFITSCIKFYKTYLMEKHVDIISINQISTKPKSSLFVHLLSKSIYNILSEKRLSYNLLYIGGVISVYLLLKTISFYIIIMVIINTQYLYLMYKRYTKIDIKHEQLNEKLKQQNKELNNLFSHIYIPSSDINQSYNKTNPSNLSNQSSANIPSNIYGPSNISTSSSLNQSNMQQQKKQNILSKGSKMQMIKQVQQPQTRTLIQQHHFQYIQSLPQISTINILQPKQSDQLIQQTIHINSDQSLNISNEKYKQLKKQNQNEVSLKLIK